MNKEGIKILRLRIKMLREQQTELKEKLAEVQQNYINATNELDKQEFKWFWDTLQVALKSVNRRIVLLESQLPDIRLVKTNKNVPNDIEIHMWI